MFNIYIVLSMHHTMFKVVHYVDIRKSRHFNLQNRMEVGAPYLIQQNYLPSLFSSTEPEIQRRYLLTLLTTDPLPGAGLNDSYTCI